MPADYTDRLKHQSAPVTNSPEPILHFTVNQNSQKRAAKTALGSRLTGDASYRYKIREKLREGGVEAFEEDRRGRPIDVELREEVRLAIKLVQENIVRPTRSDYKTEIAARLNRPISEAALTRYLSANKVQIRPQKKAKP